MKESKPNRWPLLMLISAGVVSLSMIGAGVALIHPPSALITVGGLLWIDLVLMGMRG